MAMAPVALTLIANPGSASRKYALFDGDQSRAHLSFEYVNNRVVGMVRAHGHSRAVHVELHNLEAATDQLVSILRDNDVLHEDEQIGQVGLRIVAPGGFFLQDRMIDDEVVERMEAIASRAPLHIAVILTELRALRKQFGTIPIVGVSDSAFHASKPDYAWNYGISLEDADHYEIKRFGYHGLSVAASVRTLRAAEKLPPKLIVCHLGSGASVAAVHGGKSVDTTMGYSPLEGVVMSTRSGSIDFGAVRALKDVFHVNDDGVDDYLNNHSGLLGLGGSADIRELLRREGDGDTRARLALQTYVFSVQKAVGQMAAALGGVDALVFTGTVGERSAPVRTQITARLHFLDFVLDGPVNETCESPEQLTCISRLAHSKPVYVVPTDEAGEMARRVRSITTQ